MAIGHSENDLKINSKIKEKKNFKQDSSLNMDQLAIFEND